MVKQTFQISDMHCSNCAMKIESIEDDLPGVKRVDASYARGQVTPDTIIAAVKKQGYTATLKK